MGSCHHIYRVAGEGEGEQGADSGTPAGSHYYYLPVTENWIHL